DDIRDPLVTGVQTCALPIFDGFAGGRMHLDLPAARTAITEYVAKPLGIEITDAAWGIGRIVNSNMANATRKVLAGHGADPRDLRSEERRVGKARRGGWSRSR